MVLTILVLVNLWLLKEAHAAEDWQPCAPRYVGYQRERIICVCNSTYCDSLGPLRIPQDDEIFLYESNREGKRFHRRELRFQLPNNAGVVLGSRRDGDNRYFPASAFMAGSMIPPRLHLTFGKTNFRQTILGFGGAFTDSVGLNLHSLPRNMQKMLMESYFGPSSIGYVMQRVPIAGTDFSTRKYTYDDNGGNPDPTLAHFALQPEDLKYKLPLILWAKELEPSLILLASPWTAPPWMKTNHDYNGMGLLKTQYRQLWADYIVKFLKSYDAQGAPIWGITTQNEPIDGLTPFFPLNCMGWTPQMQRDWVRDYLGPTLHKTGFQNLKVVIMDDQLFSMPKWPQIVLADPEASKYVSGVGVHWYWRNVVGYDGLNKTVQQFPDKFVMGTEASAGPLPTDKKVVLGSWERGEEYADDIIQHLTRGSVAWLDWNIALNTEGGPTWTGPGWATDCPVIINAGKKEFYKQPMFYAMGHFAKFFHRGSELLRVSMRKSLHRSVPFSFKDDVLAAAALRPDGVVVATIMNKNHFPVEIRLYRSLGTGYDGIATFQISAKSLTTITYLA